MKREVNTTRYAAIDIGSNAVRLLINIAQEHEDKTEFRKLSLIRVPVRLGKDVFTTGRITPDKKEDITNALIGFASLLKAYRVSRYMACATSAMRDSANGPEILQNIKLYSGLQVDIIDGQKEAKLVFDAGLKDFVDDDLNCLCIDLGGGSCELTVYSNGAVTSSASFQIGTVRMLTDKVDPMEFERMSEWIEEHNEQTEIGQVIGTGGNIRRYMKLASTKKNASSVAVKDLKKLYKGLKKLSYEERVDQFRLKEDRADVIVPAGYIFLEIMRHFEVNEIIVPRLGLVDGIMNKLGER